MPVQGVWFTFNSGTYTRALITLVDNGDNAVYSASTLDYALYTGACTGMGASGGNSCNGCFRNQHKDRNAEYHIPHAGLQHQAEQVAGTFGLLVQHPAHSDAAITAIISPAAGIYWHPNWHPR